MTFDLFLRCLELVTTGLCKSSSSLQGGPSWVPKEVFGSCSIEFPADVGVHSPLDPDQFVNEGTGSDSRRCGASLPGVDMPDSRSGGGP